MVARSSIRLPLGRASGELLVALVFCALTLSAQEMPVPVHLQYPILLKAMTFDRNLKERCGSAIVLGVVYQSLYRQSSNVRDELESVGREFSDYRVEGLPIRIVPIDLSIESDLEKSIRDEGINTLYVTPLRAVDITGISLVTQRNRVLTLTGLTAYVEGGLSIGVGKRGERPALVVNQRASRAEGADLDSQLLKLARTIR